MASTSRHQEIEDKAPTMEEGVPLRDHNAIKSESNTVVTHRASTKQESQPKTRPTNQIRNVPESRLLSFSRVFIRHFLKVFRDLLTYVIRGGLGTLTFSMEQVLSLFNTATGVIPGFPIVGFALRLCLWILTLVMWIVYTAVELIVYLPTKLLILYLMALAVLYAMIPDFFNFVFDWMFNITHGFLHLVRTHFVK